MSRLKPLCSLGRDQMGTLGSRNQEMEGPQLPGRAGEGQRGLGGREAGSSPSSAPSEAGGPGTGGSGASGSSPVKGRHHRAPCRERCEGEPQ